MTQSRKPRLLKTIFTHISHRNEMTCISFFPITFTIRSIFEYDRFKFYFHL